MTPKKQDPIFYLVSGELSDPRVPTACWPLARLRDSRRDDYMLVAIDPPIIGQKYGLGGQDIGHLVLAARFTGSSLFPVREWPCHVYVARIKDESRLLTSTITDDNIELISWGTLHKTGEDAAKTMYPA